MRLLIVTPTLGERDSIVRTIESVQSIVNKQNSLHVLVGPVDKLAWVKDRFSHLEIIDDKASSGIYQALNFVINLKLKNYDYFAYINDDDFWLPAFSSLLCVAEETYEYSIIAGRALHYDSLSRNYRKSSFFPNLKAFPALYRCDCPFVTQQSILFRSSEVLKFGGFDTNLPISADSDLISKVIESGSPVKLINRVVSCYDISPSDRLSNNQSLLAANKFYLNKNLSKSFAQRFIFLILFRLYNLPLYFFRAFTFRSSLDPFI